VVISYQSAEGHTTLAGLTDAEVDAKFAELTKEGYRGFASTDLEAPVGPVKSAAEARQMGAAELYMIAPFVGG
jgi:hypothetical protein